MKTWIDQDLCTGDGLCEEICPSIFYGHDDGLFYVKEEDSVRRIKRDPRFMKEWDRRAAELNIHPERTQTVIDALFAQAADGDVKAASLYLQYIEKFTPKRRLVVEDKDASSLSDLELAEELEALVAEFKPEEVADEAVE